MNKQSLGIIGVGAFGAFMAGYLAPHFDLVLCDPYKNVARLAKKLRAHMGTAEKAAACDIVVLAVPVQKLEGVLRAIKNRLRPGALVIDVASVKMKPAALMEKILPKNVAVIGTHPLFGPQSGKQGIKGLNIAVCEIRGGRAACASRFLKKTLRLNVMRTTPAAHDKELAYVQGLTHLLAKVVVALKLPRFRFTTKTYELVDQAVEFIRYDSDELFKAIERENPFAPEAKKAFFTAARGLERKLRRG